MRTRAAAFAVVLAIAAAIAAVQVHRTAPARYADAAIYLRMTLRHLGRTPDAAAHEANRVLGAPVDAPEATKQRYDLFRPRSLYPRLAAPLYARVGMRALQLVSAAAYVAAVVAVFLIVLSLARPAVAAAAAVGFALAPPVSALAAAPLPDALALLLWTVTLGAMLRYARRGDRAALAAAAVASVLLVLARPVPYEPVGAALGALVAARAGLVAKKRAAALAAAAGAAAALFWLYAVHGGAPGMLAQIRWDEDWAAPLAAHAPLLWYVASLAIALPVPCFVAALAFGLVPRRVDAEILGAAALATALEGALDPANALGATALALMPIALAVGALALERLLARRVALASA